MARPTTGGIETVRAPSEPIGRAARRSEPKAAVELVDLAPRGKLG
jgi:hypothetical protein